MLTDITVEEAQSLIIEQVRPASGEDVWINESLGRILKCDIQAPHDLPSFDQSALDGYALGAAPSSVNNRFALTGVYDLGDVPEGPLAPGEAVRVLTGGDLPSGTQAVVAWEKTDFVDNHVMIKESISPAQNIKIAGEDFHRGELLAAAGCQIEPATVGILAAFGISKVTVYNRPRVAILSLAKNVVPYYAAAERGQIHDCNGPFLQALVEQAGGVVAAIENMGLLTTDEKKARLHKLIEDTDLVIVSGGTYSGGEAEAMHLFRDAGLDIKYWGVDLHPGSHQGFGVLDSKKVFALSGNPAACAVGFHLFVAPALGAMQDLNKIPPKLAARCINGIEKKTGQRRFVRGSASLSDDGWKVWVLPGQKPSMLRSLINCNALIDLPPRNPPIAPGEEVIILLLTGAIQV